MGTRLSLVGKRFSRLTVVKEAGPNKHKKFEWYCTCDCGNTIRVASSSLTTGNTKSCGCLNTDRVREVTITHGHTINGRVSKEFVCWCNIRARCYNPENSHYYLYGARGIKVCDRWLESFENFIEDMGPAPSNKHSIDRYPNVNGDYEPSNCRWATAKEQNYNKRNTVILEASGISMPQEEWARRWNISSARIINRLKSGESFQKIFDHYEANGKRIVKRFYELYDTTKGISEWENYFGLKRNVMQHHLVKAGKSLKETVEFFNEIGLIVDYESKIRALKKEPL